jgi:uncharacterized membrane protein YqgA involved in biofilm formation
LLNGAMIVIAVVIALATKKTISAQRQDNLRVFVGAGIVFFGLKLTWSSLSGSFGFWLKQFATVLLAMMIGKIIGRILRLQKLSNSLGPFVNAKMEQSRKTFEDGFLVSTALFCLGPLAILSSVQSGLEQSFSPIFIVKSVMDALAAMAFAATFGWSIAMSAVPVVALQLAIIRVVQLLLPWAHNHPQPIIESILATDGLLIFSTSLIILQLKKIEIADYLPSLAVAPVLTLLFNK